MLSKFDTIYIALLGFLITVISVWGKIVSEDLYSDKTIKAKFIIVFSKGILGLLIVLVMIKGVPFVYPFLKDSEFLIYSSWFVAYFIVDLLPIGLELLRQKVGVQND